MAFWRKTGDAESEAARATGPDAEASAPGDEAPEQLAERALDAVAGLLRSYGELAFDIDGTGAGDTREACERWARHVLVGTPADPRHDRVETRSDGETPDESAEPGRIRRDFRRLGLYFSSHRGREKSYVTTSLADLRQAIWAMIGALRGVVTDDRRGDALAAIHLQRLGAAVDSNSTERIRREARECVRIVGEILQERQRSQQQQIQDLASRLREMRGELEQAWEQATRDPLTALGNRGAFDAQLERVVDVGFLFSELAFLFLIDVDHFTWVNDRYGHPAGDEVLRRIGMCLAANFLRKNDFVARYGGEEFAAVVRVDSAEIASRLAERVLYAIRDLEIEFDGEPVRVSVSIGVAQLRSGEDAAGLVQRADTALYAAKQAGRDRAEFAEDGQEPVKS